MWVGYDNVCGVDDTESTPVGRSWLYIPMATSDRSMKRMRKKEREKIMYGGAWRVMTLFDSTALYDVKSLEKRQGIV